MMKKIQCILMAFSFALTLSFAVSAESYQNYTYDSEGDAYIEPQAYVPSALIDGRSIGTAAFKTPSDVFIAQSGEVYVADSGNNRIVVLDNDFKLKKVITDFQNNGKQDGFKNPQGVFVTGEDVLFIADTDNQRVVSIDANGNLVKEFQNPPQVAELMDFVYKPIRVSVDNAGRIFIVSANLNKGMIELDKEGNFVSFFGAARVSSNFINLMWDRILTREQKDNSEHILPTEYSSNDIDKDGFVYGSISATGINSSSGVALKKLNPTGLDILRRTGNFDPMGDVNTLYKNGSLITSKLVDICIADHGIYSALDMQRGRIFTYDNDGNLLYVFGALGSELGSFVMPKAIDKTKDDRFLIVDQTLNHIVVFEPTEYADMINSAVVYQYNREYKNAEKQWQKVLKMTTNSEIAYVGMGKALYRQGEYKEAMEYFKLGNNRTLYSKSFKENRKNIFNDIFTPVMWIVVIALIAVLSNKWIKKLLNRRKP